MTGPKIFLKAPLAPIYTNIEGGARAEKTQFFIQNFPAAQKFWPKQGLFSALAEHEKLIWSTKNFENCHSHLRSIYF